MKLLEKTKSLLKDYGLSVLIGIGFVSTTKTLLDNTIQTRKLDNSNYEIKYQGSPISLYGYDDKKEGGIDRIEEIGVIPFKTGLPAFRIQRTHLPSDLDYSWYKNRVLELGKSK